MAGVDGGVGIMWLRLWFGSENGNTYKYCCWQWGGLAIVIDHRNILGIKQTQVKPNICSQLSGRGMESWGGGVVARLLSIWLVCADKAKRITLSCGQVAGWRRGGHSKCWKSKPLKHISFCLVVVSSLWIYIYVCVCVCHSACLFGYACFYLFRYIFVYARTNNKSFKGLTCFLLLTLLLLLLAVFCSFPPFCIVFCIACLSLRLWEISFYYRCQKVCNRFLHSHADSAYAQYLVTAKVFVEI